MRPELTNALVLAYIGDAVLEMLVRDYLVTEVGIVKPALLQKTAVQYVSAWAQASFMHAAKQNAWLTEQELQWYKRGRNTHHSRQKHKDIQAHNESSGFEAILGTLHLLNDEKRIQEIFGCYIAYINNKDRGEIDERVDLRQKHNT